MEEKNEIQEKNDVLQYTNSNNSMDSELDCVIANRQKKNIYSLLGNLSNFFEIGRNAKKIIDPDLDYVVKFTPELLKKMENNDIRFLKDCNTGELLPDLYDYTEKHIGGKVRLEIKGTATDHDFSNLNIAINNVIEQQRYDALIDEIQQLYVTAKKIERGQDNDRFAKVNAGRKHLLDALNYNGTEEDCKKMILDALVMLRDGRELIEKTLLDKLDALEFVPEGKLKRLWRCFSTPEYFKIQTERYYDIQEYFQYYYLSIQPMAYIYTYLNQPQLIYILLEDCKKVFEHKNLNCLMSVEYLLPNDDFNEAWYKNSREYEKQLLNSYESVDRNNDIYIVFKGEEILEVLDNEG